MNWHSHNEAGPGEHRRGDREGGEERGEGRGRARRGEREGGEGHEGRGEGHGPGRRGPRGGGRGFGRPGGWQNVDVPSADDAQAWFEGRLPGDWFTEVTVTADREEITVLGKLTDEVSSEAGAEAAAAEGRISRFRADTRATRIQIAEEAEARYGRKVSWGAQLGEIDALFTHISVPVMTRLRQPERQVLDTLVDSGVARSRSEALAWAVKLTGEHADTWLANLHVAMSEVDKLRSEGPEF